MAPLALATTIFELVQKYGPTAWVFIQKTLNIVHAPNPTQADWDKFFAEVQALDYDAEIKAAQARADARKPA